MLSNEQFKKRTFVNDLHNSFQYYFICLADKLKEGVPTDDSVAAIFDAINPLLPTPHNTTLD